MPSHLYSLSFAPNPDWSESFSPQAEIHEHLRGVFEDHGLDGHTHFGTEVSAAAWQEPEQRWRLETPRGTIEAEILISGIGSLTEPRTPEIPGLGGFAGKTFHSARWDQDHDLRGERVAVVGTGASAIQFIPQIQPEVAELTVFQRTPAWIWPRFNRRISGLERLLFRRFPALQRAARGAIYWSRETVVLALAARRRPVRRLVRRSLRLLARRHLARQVPDPELRRKLTPDYEVGCKRMLISNDYLPALSEPNVELIDAGVSAVRGNTVLGSDGSEREVDTIIFGTGFHVGDTPAVGFLVGREGRTLEQVWAGSPAAHLGTTVAGFPNLFVLFGPGTGIGHTSATVMIEAQVGYVLDALERIERERIGAVEVRAEVQAASVAALDRMMADTVWMTGGCASWYLDERGRNSALWPTFTFHFTERMRRFELGEFRVEPRREGDRPVDPAEPEPAVATG